VTFGFLELFHDRCTRLVSSFVARCAGCRNIKERGLTELDEHLVAQRLGGAPVDRRRQRRKGGAAMQRQAEQLLQVLPELGVRDASFFDQRRQALLARDGGRHHCGGGRAALPDSLRVEFTSRGRDDGGNVCIERACQLPAQRLGKFGLAGNRVCALRVQQRAERLVKAVQVVEGCLNLVHGESFLVAGPP